MTASYLDRLIDDLGRRPERVTRVKLRSLLRACGYTRRRREAVAVVHAALHQRGLAADFTLRRPARLDDRVVVRLVARRATTGSPLRTVPVQARPGGGASAAQLQAMPAVSGVPAGPVLPAALAAPGARTVPGGPPTPGRLTTTAPSATASATALPALGPPTAPAPADDLSAMAQDAVRATVLVECAGSIGAGVIIHPDGLVLTARHVIHDGRITCREVPVRLADGKRARGVVFWSHWPLDLALCWLDRPGPFAHLPLGDSAALRLAEPLIAVGHPSAFANTVTRGIVSNPRAQFNGVECLQTDAAQDEGNSGGPILNVRGELMAISVWKFGDLDSAKFAIPVDYVADEIAQAVALGRKACLKGRYCLACGHLDLTPTRRTCPICGSEEVVHGRPRP